MLRLAFDNTLKFGIKPKVKIAIYAAPVVGMLASTVLTFLFSAYLAEKLGIPEGVSVKGQENGGLWMFLMLCTLPGSAFVGYVVGWLWPKAAIRLESATMTASDPKRLFDALPEMNAH